MVRVSLAADSRYIGWDILCLGRAAAGERFEKGRFDLFFGLTVEMYRSGSSAAVLTAATQC
jgi:urease accessory protein UreH